MSLPDVAQWPRLPLGYTWSVREHSEPDNKGVMHPKVTISLLKGEVYEVAQDNVAAAKRGEYSKFRIGWGTIDVEFYGNGSAVLERMRSILDHAKTKGIVES